MAENNIPTHAMILAAGLGTRMRPITDTIPKPLVKVAGKTMLDHALDALAAAGTERAIVNLHYLPEQIEGHVNGRSDIDVAFSDERKELLDSGGGIKHALGKLGGAPFFILNSDTFWVEPESTGLSNLQRMTGAWNSETTDILLMLSPLETAVGFEGRGDFFMDNGNRLTRRGNNDAAPYVYAGAIIAKPKLFIAEEDRKFSLNLLFDKAIAKDRLRGFVMDGLWLHVGTPAAIGEAEAAVEAFRARAVA